MDNKTRQTGLRQRHGADLSATGRSKGWNDEAQVKIAKEITDRFHAMKTYGKEPEALDGIIAVMMRDLQDFEPQTVLRAFSTHAQRSQEFPTTADIVGLIKRNGKPPMLESRYISISRKNGEDRTDEEWRYLKAYESEQASGWNDTHDTAKQDDFREENIRLRQEGFEARMENKRLNRVIDEMRAKLAEPAPPPPSHAEKVRRTIAAMAAANFPKADIDAFRAQQGASAQA